MRSEFLRKLFDGMGPAD